MTTSPLYTLWPGGPVIDLDALCAVVPGTTNTLIALHLNGNTLTVPASSCDISALLWSWNCWRVATTSPAPVLTRAAYSPPNKSDRNYAG